MTSAVRETLASSMFLFVTSPPTVIASFGVLCGVHGLHDEPEQHSRAMLPPVTPHDVPCTFFLILRVAVPSLQPVVGGVRDVTPRLQPPTLFHGCSIDCHRPPSNRGLDFLVVPSGFPSRPESPVFLCGARAGPPPQFEPSMDRRMEWSPSPPWTFREWAAQWLCVSCNKTADFIAHSAVVSASSGSGV